MEGEGLARVVDMSFLIGEGEGGGEGEGENEGDGWMDGWMDICSH